MYVGRTSIKRKKEVAIGAVTVFPPGEKVFLRSFVSYYKGF